MLRVLARTLRNTIWPTDFVGRWSDDRFLVILSGCDQEALRAVSERMLRMAVRATIEWWGEELSVAVLIGSTAAAAGDSAESLLLRAQEALTTQRTGTVRARGRGHWRDSSVQGFEQSGHEFRECSP